MACMRSVVIGLRKLTDLEVVLAREALEVRDEAPVLLVQQEKNFFLDLERIWRYTNYNLEVL